MFKTHAVQTIGASEHRHLNIKYILYYPIYKMLVGIKQLSEIQQVLERNTPSLLMQMVAWLQSRAYSRIVADSICNLQLLSEILRTVRPDFQNCQ